MNKTTRAYLIALLTAASAAAGMIPVTLRAVDDGAGVPVDRFLQRRDNRTVYQFEVPRGLYSVTSLSATIHVRDDGDAEQEGFFVEFASNLGSVNMRDFCCYLAPESAPVSAAVPAWNLDTVLDEIGDNDRFKIRVIRGFGDFYVENVDVALEGEMVPEPAAGLTLAAGLAALLLRRRIVRR